MAEKIEEFELKVSVPKDKVNIENLKNLLSSKGELIKKALGIDSIQIEVTEDEVVFPWFDSLTDFETSTVYANFIGALCQYSKERSRILAKERPVENEKYAFRCFLLRLGFIGPEHKADRKILLQNLSGSAAFKNAKAQELAG